MAEIKIEKRKAIWPWLLLILAVLALLIWFFWFRGEPDKENTLILAPPVSDRIDERENNNTVADYIAFVQADSATMGLDHTYTHGMLIKLIDATKEMARETGYDIKGDLDQAKAYADTITENPMATTHANNIRKAADILGSVLQNMQRAAYPTLSSESAEVVHAAAAINPDDLTLDQRDTVKAFFRKAADLLQKMN